MTYKDDTPAIFHSIDGATKVQGLMDARDDIVATCTSRRFVRGEIKGYTVTCKDTAGRTFKVSNDMVEQLYEQVA